MDCISNTSSKVLHCDEEDKVSNNINIVITNEDVIQQQVNNPTTSRTSSNDVPKQRKCLGNIEKSNKEDDEGVTNMPYLQTMIATAMIVKGKRTKRERIHSPIIRENKCTYNQEDNVQVIPAEDEDLDTANCLILLAKGPSRPPLIRRNELGLFTSSRGSTIRFTSDNIRPYYNNTTVYECKTCNRIFPSFQALGGHRASHKKLKITTTTDDNDHSFSQMVTVASPPSPISLQLGNNLYIRASAPTHTPLPNAVAKNNKNRIHECAICGGEFSSGQALGGHMRRHRGSIMPLNSSTTTTTTTTTTTNKPTFANTTLSLSTAANNAVAAAFADSKVNRISDGFPSLDLNVPASPSPLPTPDQDHQDQTKLPQSSSGLVLSTPALVDCLY